MVRRGYGVRHRRGVRRVVLNEYEHQFRVVSDEPKYCAWEDLEEDDRELIHEQMANGDLPKDFRVHEHRYYMGQRLPYLSPTRPQKRVAEAPQLAHWKTNRPVLFTVPLNIPPAPARST